MELPQPFEERMVRWLGEEYAAFRQALEAESVHGLRANRLKVAPEALAARLPFALEPVPWAPDGFVYGQGDRPSRHPYYFAGLYYLQEPSAMLPATLLDVRPGERVLDLCAAPGGKATQLAAALGGRGVLVANDVHPKRIKALVHNLEVQGVTNAVVTNDYPAHLARVFPAYFDKVLVDAPCSGEGMFRKDPALINEWSLDRVNWCIQQQKGLLRHAATMLRPGGLLVYSTCTFNPEENEAIIEWFLRRHPEFELVDVPHQPGWAGGRPDWVDGGRPELARCIRLWPHRVRGEGHFVAVLRKSDAADAAGDVERVPPTGRPPHQGKQALEVVPPDPWMVEAVARFEAHHFTRPVLTAEGRTLIRFGRRLFLMPSNLPDLSAVRLVRPGWLIGDVKKDRYRPSPALALALSVDDIRPERCVNLPADSDEVMAYLHGEPLGQPLTPGWNLVAVDGYPLGWMRQLPDRQKNAYPEAWRLSK
ncbi:MAG TPA: RsmB/NOP family class I SAM-dependent RNA methyltransferase [Calditerricola sp.]